MSVDTAPAKVVPVDLEFEYRRHVEGLPFGEQGKRLRLIGMEQFLARHSDIAMWMDRPTAARLTDVRRTNAWPFLTWCFAVGHVQPDVDLLAAHPRGGHFRTWCRLHRDDADRAVEVGRQLGWAASWVHQVCESALAFVCMTSDASLDGLTEEILDATLAAVDAAPTVTANHRGVLTCRIRALGQVCFQLGLIDRPPLHANSRERGVADYVAAIPQPEIRRIAERYLHACATTLRPSTVENRGSSLELFGIWLAETHPEITSLEQLDRAIVEEFLIWNHGRPSRGKRGAGQPVSIVRQHQAVSTLKTFLEDLTLWGWAERPSQPLLYRSDLPRLPESVPRALSPNADRDLMAAVEAITDPAARCAIKILRGTGVRLGELLDLELGCLLDYADHGTWLHVPLGKLNTERTIPLDDPTLDVFHEWIQHRGQTRPLPHPRTHRPVDFLWVVNGRRMGAGRIRRHLDLAATKAGIGHVHPHQLRHTYATSLVNGGMSLEALMAVLGHVSPEMTLRYASLTSETVRDAYTTAIAKTQPKSRLRITPPSQTFPDKHEWLHSEWIKTRLAHGTCTRHPAAGPCPSANICEQCDNFVPDPHHRDTLTDQLADVIELHDDAARRGWDDEAIRHQQVADALNTHLQHLDRHHPQHTTP